jgi:hypothetical protein
MFRLNREEPIEKASACTALEESLSTLSLQCCSVRFGIAEYPRYSSGGEDCPTLVVLSQTRFRVGGVTYVAFLEFVTP